jgi:hypothetical protein
MIFKAVYLINLFLRYLTKNYKDEVYVFDTNFYNALKETDETNNYRFHK